MPWANHGTSGTFYYQIIRITYLFNIWLFTKKNIVLVIFRAKLDKLANC